MKKTLEILTILFTIFYFNLSFAMELPKDVVSGNSYFKSMNEFGQFKDYGVKIVDKTDGHPVRFGQKSLRFEIRGGDCQKNSKGWNDCELKRERHELHGKKLFRKGEWWYAWSIYFPRQFKEVAPVRVYIGQFHSQDTKYGDEKNPPWMFFNTARENLGGYWVNNMVRVPAGFATQLLTRDEAYGKWNDILINVNWSEKDDGYMKIWANDKIKLDYKGPTKRKGAVYFRFGLYRVRVFDNNTPKQIVYFDEIRTGKNREDVTKDFK